MRRVKLSVLPGPFRTAHIGLLLQDHDHECTQSCFPFAPHFSRVRERWPGLESMLRYAAREHAKMINQRPGADRGKSGQRSQGFVDHSIAHDGSAYQNIGNRNQRITEIHGPQALPAGPAMPKLDQRHRGKHGEQRQAHPDVSHQPGEGSHGQHHGAQPLADNRSHRAYESADARWPPP